MCGYCIESGVVLKFVESDFRYDIDGDDGSFLNYSYLQEGDSLIEEISRIEGINNHQDYIDIIFCRILDQYLTHGFDFSFYTAISSSINLDPRKPFPAENKEFLDDELWALLGNEAIYKDDNCWNEFIGKKEHLLQLSLAVLNSYYNWWIAGENKEKSDPDQRMKETGVMDPIENTTAIDWDKFYSIFPLVSFSLSFVSKYGSKSEIIKKIALNSPHDTPGFDGIDLWLQRRAYLLCANEYGLGFVMDNLSNIRPDLPYYLLLKTEMGVTELEKLKACVLSTIPKIQMDTTLEDVGGLIDRLIQKKATLN